jgi:hypothetical protein
MAPVPNPGSEDLEFAKYLWEEYRYRHDLIWRLLFRVTAVAALLSIVPFTISDQVRDDAGFAVDLLPALALVLIFASWVLVRAEWKRFEPINKDYREAQKRVRQRLQKEGHLPAPQPVSGPKRETRDVFRLIVYWYPGVLLLLAGVVSLIVWL